ncbi:MAG TPA: MauE/DoxX family redox-associated membrane protein [Acidimicrobiales bacterium]|jgi:uncharacterized membrane protein YphA (DoxX/SURF4 family)|nr:MauE/DoxX family redox-associated membrane protein [Acidimicrobiales bacterium]
MDELASAAALVLAIVFVWAGVAKLARPSDTAESFAALGLPAAKALARVVPVVELALAAGLVFRPAVASWAALVVLGAFTFVIWVAIHRGVQAPCNCFGSARKEPVSTLELVRNAMLAGLAVIATAAHGAAGWPGVPSVIAITVIVAFGRLSLALAEFRRTGGRIFPTMPGGSPR